MNAEEDKTLNAIAWTLIISSLLVILFISIELVFDWPVQLPEYLRATIDAYLSLIPQ